MILVVVAVLAGCGSESGSGTTAEDDEARGGAEWINVEEGRATPSPAVKRGTASPTPADGLPTLPVATRSPTAKPDPTCTAVQSIAGVEGLDVQPGRTTAVVSWYHPGGNNIVDYRVTAISQDLRVGAQKEVGWTQVAPARCGDVTATMAGLEPKTAYIFSLDVVKTRQGVDGTITETIARSQVVSTT